MRRVALLVGVVALAGAASAGATLPNYPSGTSVGEGVPLKAYASLSPTVQFFGAPVIATLAVVADTKFVDPLRLRVVPSFKPYRPVRPVTIERLRVGRFAQVTWTWTLRCLTLPCVPRIPPSDRFHVFRFQPVNLKYLTADGRPAYKITASWPALEVYSQVTVATEQRVIGNGRLHWAIHPAPVAAPTYRISPSTLFWLALGIGIAFFALAALLAWRWYLAVRPRPVMEPDVVAARTTLERALAVLAWAHEHGDETLQRKAFERVADELGLEAPLPEVDELTRTARELAWSSRTPADYEVETFAEQARGTGKRDELEPEPEEVEA
jgi:hypothetical protein